MERHCHALRGRLHRPPASSACRHAASSALTHSGGASDSMLNTTAASVCSAPSTHAVPTCGSEARARGVAAAAARQPHAGGERRRCPGALPLVPTAPPQLTHQSQRLLSAGRPGRRGAQVQLALGFQSALAYALGSDQTHHQQLQLLSPPPLLAGVQAVVHAQEHGPARCVQVYNGHQEQREAQWHAGSGPGRVSSCHHLAPPHHLACISSRRAAASSPQTINGCNSE